MKLGDVLQVVNGKNQKAVEDENGQYPIYGSGGQMGWANSFICPANTVIIGRKGNINKPIYVSEPFWNVDTAFGLVAKPEVLDARYLYHFCKHYDFEKLNTTCTIPSLTRKNVEGILLRLPSFEQQKEMTARFDSILKQITLAQQQLSYLDSLVKSRFVEMFGGLSGYESRALEECVSVIESGKSPKCLAKPREGGDPGVLKLSAISSGVYKETENKALPSGAKVTDGKMVRDGDILLARKNTPELVGQSVLVNHTEGNIMFPDIVFRMRVRPEVDEVYLSYALAHPLAGAIKSLAHGSAKSMSNIPKSKLAKLSIPLPPLALQREFAAFASQVDKSRFVAQQQIEKLQMLYDSLAQEYFGD